MPSGREHAQAMEVDVAGDGADAGFERLGGLVAGRGAEVEEGEAGVEIEQRHDGLRADVLDAADAGAAGGEAIAAGDFGGFEGGVG